MPSIIAVSEKITAEETKTGVPFKKVFKQCARSLTGLLLQIPLISGFLYFTIQHDDSTFRIWIEGSEFEDFTGYMLDGIEN